MFCDELINLGPVVTFISAELVSALNRSTGESGPRELVIECVPGREHERDGPPRASCEQRAFAAALASVNGALADKFLALRGFHVLRVHVAVALYNKIKGAQSEAIIDRLAHDPDYDVRPPAWIRVLMPTSTAIRFRAQRSATLVSQQPEPAGGSAAVARRRPPRWTIKVAL